MKRSNEGREHRRVRASRVRIRRRSAEAPRRENTASGERELLVRSFLDALGDILRAEASGR